MFDHATEARGGPAALGVARSCRGAEARDAAAQEKAAATAPTALQHICQPGPRQLSLCTNPCIFHPEALLCRPPGQHQKQTLVCETPSRPLPVECGRAPRPRPCRSNNAPAYADTVHGGFSSSERTSPKPPRSHSRTAGQHHLGSQSRLLQCCAWLDVPTFGRA